MTVVQAPGPAAVSGRVPPNRVESVVLQPGEDVVWTWTHDRDGASYVNGYRIIKARRKPNR